VLKVSTDDDGSIELEDSTWVLGDSKADELSIGVGSADDSMTELNCSVEVGSIELDASASMVDELSIDDSMAEIDGSIEL